MRSVCCCALASSLVSLICITHNRSHYHARNAAPLLQNCQTIDRSPATTLRYHQIEPNTSAQHLKHPRLPLILPPPPPVIILDNHPLPPITIPTRPRSIVETIPRASAPTPPFRRRLHVPIRLVLGRRAAVLSFTSVLVLVHTVLRLRRRRRRCGGFGARRFARVRGGARTHVF